MDCPYCKGTGIVKHSESVALEVMRHLKLLTARDQVANIEVTLHPEVGEYINNAKRAALARLEADTHRRIRVRSNPAAGIDQVTYHCTDDRGAEVRTDYPPPAPAHQAPPPPKEEPPRPGTPEESV
jgi:Ribonuclease G/E